MTKSEKISLAVIGLLAAVIGLTVVVTGMQSRSFNGGGISSNNAAYQTATSTSAICSGATSTLLLAAASGQGQRNTFELTVVSSSITLCKSALGCLVGKGLNLGTATSTGQYFQSDGYYGPYSCIGGQVSSTVGLIISQN